MKNILILLGFFLLFLGVMNISNKSEIFEYSDTSNISLTIDGAETDKFPLKTSNLKVKTISCNDSVESFWDYESWSLKIKKLNKTGIKCSIDFVKSYSEPLLNGTDPLLNSNMIPVIIEENGVVKKANLSEKWYSYEEKKWANAVILNDESKKYYDGEIIPESEIESYFVWIPKFKYKLWNMGTYTITSNVDYNQMHAIEVVFGLNNTINNNTECITPMKSGESGTCSVGKFMTHPAFLSIPSNGFWVGKFMTGFKNKTDNIVDSNNIQIKPNVLAWRHLQLANIHLNSFNYQRVLNSHAMKSTEWGSVAYLSQSKYGNGSNIRINNTINVVTGYAAIKEPTCGARAKSEDCNAFGVVIPNESTNISEPYQTEIGGLASTTGNITGIYDMAGGYSETLMGIMVNEKNIPVIGIDEKYESGFQGPYGVPNSILENKTGVLLPDIKYYDTYLYNKDAYNTDYKRRILGDATGELGPFFKPIEDYMIISSWHQNLMSQYFSSMYSIDTRGYGFNGGTVSGIFAFQGTYGFGNAAYRIVLTL